MIPRLGLSEHSVLIRQHNSHSAVILILLRIEFKLMLQLLLVEHLLDSVQQFFLLLPALALSSCQSLVHHEFSLLALLFCLNDLLVLFVLFVATCLEELGRQVELRASIAQIADRLARKGAHAVIDH